MRSCHNWLNFTLYQRMITWSFEHLLFGLIIILTLNQPINNCFYYYFLAYTFNNYYSTEYCECTWGLLHQSLVLVWGFWTLSSYILLILILYDSAVTLIWSKGQYCHTCVLSSVLITILGVQFISPLFIEHFYIAVNWIWKRHFRKKIAIRVNCSLVEIFPPS